MATRNATRNTINDTSGALGPTAADDSADETSCANQVFLRGRLGATPEVRSLPSGDQLCTFRITIDRPVEERGRVDTIDCAAPLRRVRAGLRKAPAGSIVAVTGSLRRRFWRSAGALASRYEVQVETATVIRRQSGASAARTQASA